MTEIDPELSRLYREASRENPPTVLDAAILAAAHAQVAKPRRAARSSWVRWMAPASALATLMVAVSLAFLVERERSIDDTASRQIPPRPQSPPPDRAAESTKAKAADNAAAASAGKKETRSVPLPAHAPVLAAPVPAPRPAEPAAPAAQAFPTESRARMAAPATSRPKAATESNVAGDAATGGLGAASPAAPAAAGKLAPIPQQTLHRSPEAWLDEISRLRREGSEKEAAEQLAEFRRAYPAYAVPENLLK